MQDIYLLGHIIMANLVSLSASLLLAAIAGHWFMHKGLEPMISFAAGTLLAMALLHLLPEAQDGLMDQGLSHESLFALLLTGLLLFFVLEKLALFRHSHHHEHDGHEHHHGHDKAEAGAGGWMILVGSGVHNFTDGLLIAAAFLTSVPLGWFAALTIGLHEIMHKLSDYAVLLNAGFSKKRSLMYIFACGMTAVLGGILGFFVLSDLQSWVPYVLVLSASAFLYISVADLIPQINQHKGDWRRSLLQTVMLLLGVGLVWVLTQGHQHAGHEHVDAPHDIHVGEHLHDHEVHDSHDHDVRIQKPHDNLSSSAEGAVTLSPKAKTHDHDDSDHKEAVTPKK